VLAALFIITEMHMELQVLLIYEWVPVLGKGGGWRRGDRAAKMGIDGVVVCNLDVEGMRR